MRTNWLPHQMPLDYSRKEIWNKNYHTGQRVKMVLLPEHPPIPDIDMECPLPDEDEGKDCPGYENCEDCPKAVWSIEERSQ